MSGIVNFNAQIAPLEHVEKVVRQEQEYSQVKQEALMQGASQALGRDSEQVQKTVPARKDRRASRRTADERGGGGSAFAQKERGPDEPDDGENPDECPQSGVWAGNIVNLKV